VGNLLAALRVWSLRSVLATAENSSSSVKGFARYSSAPVFIASTAPFTLGYPVIIITSISLKFSRICLKRCTPLKPGILRSVMTRSIGVTSRILIASVTFSAAKTMYPTLTRLRWSTSSVAAESSTMRIRSLSSVQRIIRLSIRVIFFFLRAAQFCTLCLSLPYLQLLWSPHGP